MSWFFFGGIRWFAVSLPFGAVLVFAVMGQVYFEVGIDCVEFEPLLFSLLWVKQIHFEMEINFVHYV